VRLRRLLKTLKKYKDMKTLGVALIAFPEPTGISDIVGTALVAISTLNERDRQEVLRWRTLAYAGGCISKLELKAYDARIMVLLSNLNVNCIESFS